MAVDVAAVEQPGTPQQAIVTVAAQAPTAAQADAAVAGGLAGALEQDAAKEAPLLVRAGLIGAAVFVASFLAVNAFLIITAVNGNHISQDYLGSIWAKMGDIALAVTAGGGLLATQIHRLP